MRIAAFVIDFGTILNIIMGIMYLIIVITFPFVKRGSLGLKREICLKSEKIWHKVHVASGIGTIPALVISIILLFVTNRWVKTIISILLFFLQILIWDIIIRLVTKKDAEEIRLREEKELKEQIKKESGWL